MDKGGLTMNTYSSPTTSGVELDGSNLHVGIIVARFNHHITDPMFRLAYTELIRSGTQPENIQVINVPGSYELAITAQTLLGNDTFDVLICFGCVMKGATRHDVLIGDAAAHGLQHVALTTQVPIVFGVICAENQQQAEERIVRGTECAQTAIELACTLKHLRKEA